MKQIDLHTHQVKPTESIQVLNVFAQDLPFIVPGCLFSSGLHPWHIGNVNPEECFQAIDRAATQKNMLAIGECGLDRSVGVDFALQKLYFEQQIVIAEKHDNPLIIHCVRAYSDLLKLKKEDKSGVPWIIHGYHGNLETTLSLIRHGFYFSVGERLLKDEPKQGIFRTIPIERLFLETDESKRPITEIYSMAAQSLRLDENELAQIIARNFTSVFGLDHLDSEQLQLEN
jgi:TatD DNase family protein